MMEQEGRKVIQITADSNPESEVYLYALCNDGSIWKLVWVLDHQEWQQINVLGCIV